MLLRHALLVLPALMFSGLSLAGEILQLTPPQLAALGIETALAHGAAAGREGTLPGRVRIPDAQVRVLAAPVGGRVDHLAVATGEQVRRGQLVARLASAEALALQRELLAAETEAELARRSLARDRTLFAEGLIPEARMQATGAAAVQAAAAARERRQGLALAGAAASGAGGSLALSAPIDGVVVEQAVALGERVEAAAPIYRIATLAPLWLEIQAPLSVAGRLRKGMTMRVAGGAAAGTLITVGRIVDEASQTVMLRVSVAEGAQRLRPGQVVEVEVPPGAGQRLPAAALVRHGGATLAFVRTADDGQGARFEARPVRVLDEGGETVTVEGVGAEERVAVAGVSGLKALLAGMGGE